MQVISLACACGCPLILIKSRLLLLAAAVPDQEVEHLAFRVLGARPLEGDRERYVIAAAVEGKPSQKRAIKDDLVHEPIEVDSGFAAH